MKKHFSLLAMAAMAAFCLTSCSDDEDEDKAPELVPVEATDGVFVVNGGNKSGGIDGTLTYYDYATGTATQKVYQARNHVSLGGTVNHAVVYGSKIYIVGTDESTIFVADRKTLEKVANIKATANNKSVKPREAVAGNGYVYVSTFDNEILVIDTLTNSLKDYTYKCGYYTEGFALHNGNLYTADSNYGGYGDKPGSFPSISKINLTTRETVTIKDELIYNPTDICSVGGRLFFLDMGNYANLTASLYELTTDGKVKHITDATAIAADNNRIYIINAPYGAPSPTYKVFDTTTNALTDFCNGDDIISPNKISTDPVKGYVYITSYNRGSSGYADYKADGYCVIYNEAGVKQGQFNCGVGAGDVVPNFSVDYVQVPQ